MPETRITVNADKKTGRINANASNFSKLTN